MIWTFEIELSLGAYAEDDWHVAIEIESTSTLETFHFTIQEAVEFDNDHLYEFYISRTERSRDRVIFDAENERIYSTTLESLYPLEKGKKLYYMFDYGDSWLFKITKNRKKPQEPKRGEKYPRIVGEVGKKPEQYPVWEE